MHPAIKYAEQICYSSKEVLHFTYEMAKKYADKPGVYVECGVAAGAQIIAMAAGAPNKTIYAFDSFEGIPLPSNKDNQMPGIRILSKEQQQALPNPGEQVLESSGATSVSLKDFYAHLACAFGNNLTIYDSNPPIYYPGEQAKYVVPVVGWFEETVKEFSKYYSINEISILRLDGDLYNSTYVCLKYLYPKVIKGGLIIIDDWALPGCRQAVVDYFEETENKSIASTVAYWTK